jgi:REP element-mobilizing transposase RayT
MAGSFTSLNFHIVFSTKERRPILKPELRIRLFPYIAGIIHNQQGSLIQAGGVDDHLHLLVRLHQNTAIADCVRTIKSNASKWVRETHDDRWLGWQDGYGAFTVSRSHVPEVEAYIQNQETHHARASFQDEFRALLKRHDIEFDERYLWE